MSKPEEKEMAYDQLKKIFEETRDYQKETRDLTKEVITLLSQKQTTTTSTPTPSTSDFKQEKESAKHWTAEEKWRDRNDCPDGKCVGEIEKLGKIWLQNFKKERENEPDICDPKKGGCGLGVNSQKEGECPLCGGKDAKPRKR